MLKVVFLILKIKIYYLRKLEKLSALNSLFSITQKRPSSRSAFFMYLVIGYYCLLNLMLVFTFSESLITCSIYIPAAKLPTSIVTGLLSFSIIFF